MKVALSTDHAGYERIKKLRTFLEGVGYECVYFGPTSFQADDDYPDFIFPAALAVAKGECEKGIIMGGSGQGEAMAANRVKGVRCAVFYGSVITHEAVDAEGRVTEDPLEIVKLSREHNDANVLSIAARFVGDDDAARAAQVWLDTPFSHEARHQRRIEKLG